MHVSCACKCNSTRTFLYMPDSSGFYPFPAPQSVFLNHIPKHSSISPPCNTGSDFFPRVRTFRQTENYEVEDTVDSTKIEYFLQKVEELGIHCNSCVPGQFTYLFCPKCDGRQSMGRSLSFHISKNMDLAMWRCFYAECGWSGQVLADDRVGYKYGVNQYTKIGFSSQSAKGGWRLEPLGNKLTEYFAKRMITKEILQKNSVMQRSGSKNIIAFTYTRDGVIVSCKYRSIDKKFWLERGSEKILYGLDDIKEENEIIIVEGEIDKLSMEEAGFHNCVSVPNGAPQKVSTEQLPPLQKDTRFQYLWNCREYLDKVSRIILATDGDIPGQVLAEELARRLGKERCLRVHWPKKDEFNCFKDANEVLKMLGRGVLMDVINNAESY